MANPLPKDYHTRRTTMREIFLKTKEWGENIAAQNVAQASKPG
jgi:hypothetical protein